MKNFFDILSLVSPIIIMLVIGFLFNKLSIFSDQLIEGIKKVVFYITLPVVLFGAFYNVKYNYSVFICFITVFSCCVLAMLVGFIIKKIFKFNLYAFPFLVTSFEAGMLGYALFSIGYGTNNISKFATVDLGQTVFVYTIMMTTLYYQSSGNNGIRLALKSISKTPAFWAVFSGIMVGITGFGMHINTSLIGTMISNNIKFIGSPTGALILLIVGYELNFSISNIKSAVLTIIFRLLIMLPLALLALKIINTFSNNTDPILTAALMTLFILPAPFVIPLFVDNTEEKEYISTTLSLNTLVSLVLFIVIIAIF